MNATSSRAVVAYIPVLHRGYLDLFRESRASKLFLIDPALVADEPELDYLVRKDVLRAITTSHMEQAINALGVFTQVTTLNRSRVDHLNSDTLVMPDEDISHILHKRFFSSVDVEFIPIFLRWHRDNTQEQKQVQAHANVSVGAFERQVMRHVEQVARKSFDWWRQVAAAIVIDENVAFIGCNTHTPDPQAPNVFGDPRAVFKRGVNVELSTARHAEGALIAEAARKGVSLEGASIYVTDFPCPFCARMIAHSGIKKVYFSKGYAMLDGEDVLKQQGVETIAIT